MRQLGAVDAALLPIGGTYTMDINEAVKAAAAINPVVAIPIHHLKANPEEFNKKLQDRSNVSGLSLGIGETYQLN